MATVARHVRVTGRVQGVFFRAWTQQEAKRQGVAGWVRNCPDGSVEGHLEGDEESVARAIEMLHDGPPSARVEAVSVDEVSPSGLSGFEVRR